MRVVLQRVTWATVAIEGREIGRIGPGLLALVGVGRDDDAVRAQRMADKTARLRLFRNGTAAVADLPDHGVLCVSQFTLLASVRRGTRPSWSAAAPPELARPLVDAYVERLRAVGVAVQSGRFGAQMQVALCNDGPLTLVLDSQELERAGRSGGGG